MRFEVSTRDEVCNETRPRPYGYKLRCLEPAGHGGPHRWVPELAGDEPVTRGAPFTDPRTAKPP
jgi:hypothetical protein